MIPHGGAAAAVASAAGGAALAQEAGPLLTCAGLLRAAFPAPPPGFAVQHHTPSRPAAGQHSLWTYLYVQEIPGTHAVPCPSTLDELRSLPWCCALAREHPLVSGGETSIVTNALQRPQYMFMCACPIRGMVEAGIDVVPGTFTTHEIPLTGAWHVRKRSEDRVVGEPEELMKEGDIAILRDCLRGARRTSAACRPCTAHLAKH